MKYKDSFNLNNKNIIVTGACGILGSKFCHALANNGANIIIADIDENKCKNLASEINEKYKSQSMGIMIDLSSEDSVSSFYDSAFQHYDSIDVLINNAAVKPKGFFSQIEDYSLETWNQVIGVNITGQFLMVRSIYKKFKEQGHGNIVNLSSIYGIVGPDQRIYEGSWYEELGGSINTPLSYSTTKGAVVSFTKHLSSTWGKDNIRVNCISPGGVSSGQNSTFSDQYSNRVPLGKMAESDDIVGAMLYLCSDISNYISGHNLVVDGGLSAW
jgi:NAD(P)-dependent dehydrogenase (short-subunit alcohol dehydrogenase family)